MPDSSSAEAALTAASRRGDVLLLRLTGAGDFVFFFFFFLVGVGGPNPVTLHGVCHSVTEFQSEDEKIILIFFKKIY